MIRSCTLVLLVLFCLLSAVHAEVIDRIAAIVNGDVVTQSEIDAIGKLGLNVSGFPPGLPILQDRIDHHLVLQQIAKQPPISVPPERVQQVLDSYVQKYGGTEQLIAFLNSIGMNYQDFDSEVREQLSIQAFLSQRFRPFINVTIDEAERYYNEVYKPRYENSGQTAPPFATSFDDIQQEIVDAQVQESTRKWLADTRQAAIISVKE